MNAPHDATHYRIGEQVVVYYKPDGKGGLLFKNENGIEWMKTPITLDNEDIKPLGNEMSELISGKEALIALANGEEVETFYNEEWLCARNLMASIFLDYKYKFRLKPRTITINGIEVPAPFKPKDGDTYFVINNGSVNGYGFNIYSTGSTDDIWIQFGAWRTEEEIKQVVEALRTIFK